jgi:hypothetical protein
VQFFSDRHESFLLLTESDSSEGLEPNYYAALVLVTCWTSATLRTGASGLRAQLSHRRCCRFQPFDSTMLTSSRRRCTGEKPQQVSSRRPACVIHRSREEAKSVSASRLTPTLINVLPLGRPTSQPSLMYDISRK